MFVQILIYVYLGICAGMILFNIATALLSRRREHRSFRDGIRLELTVSRELDRLAETGAVSERHLRFMERRLRRVNGMAAFDAALERLCVRRPELTRSYLTALNGVTITLAEDYCRRDEIEAAYFPYIIKKYQLLGGADDAPLKEVLLKLLNEPSIYCRENAMQALYTSGDAQIIVRALRIIDASSLYYNTKLLADGLLNFNGDKTQLAEALWAAFEDFKVWMQVTILNYFRFSSGAHCERVFCSLSLSAFSQLTYGTTGLLHAPSAEMQRDKTFMVGGNFLNKELTPPTWYYHTYNYFLNVTIFPFLEVAYTCTLFKAEALGLKPYGYSGFTNQDRYFSARLRVLKEGQFWKYMPAVVLGTSDPFTSSGGGQVSTTEGNGYYSRFYIAASKQIPVAGKEEVGVHLSYLYNDRKEYKLNGFALGVTYNPSFHPQLRMIAEYDSKDFALGATYLLFKHLHVQVEMQRMKYFTGGLTYKIHLK